jgi:ABC-type polysaccharide/polyol phosphate export permease
MTSIIEMLRGSVIYSTSPTIGDTVFIIASALVFLAFGYLIFLKLESRFAEEM